MPSTPTTKSQVQAYKFVLRRMQSALVRKDAVMLHDPMRTHTRATVVGVCLAAVGLVGFLVWGLLSPSPTLPSQDGIVISKESGTVYVLLNNPRKLIPTFNLASARLLLLAQHQNQNGAQGQPPQTAAATEVVEPTVVADKDLKDVPKGRLMGIQDGPQLLPGPDQRISDDWAVCDAYKLNHSLTDPASENKVETTVLAGVHNLGTPLGDDRGLLVQSDNKKNYLVYHLTSSPNIPNTDTVRAEIDMTDPVMTKAFDIKDGPRKITTPLLNAIPEVRALTAPKLQGRGSPPEARVHDFVVGTVFSIQRASEGGGTEYYVQEQKGIQQVKPTTADLVRFSNSVPNGERIIPVQPNDIAGIPLSAEIDEEFIPAMAPKVLVQTAYPVACLGWSLNASGEGHTNVYVDNESQGVPVPRDKVDPGTTGVKITSPNANHTKIDYFYMPAGRAAVIRNSTAAANYRTSPIVLVSDRGVKFGVPDSATAAALGLSDQRPAPGSIIGLLPDGANLNTRDVLQSFDTIPPVTGTYETSTTPTAGAPQNTGNQGGQPGG